MVSGGCRGIEGDSLLAGGFGGILVDKDAFCRGGQDDLVVFAGGLRRFYLEVELMSTCLWIFRDSELRLGDVDWFVFCFVGFKGMLLEEHRGRRDDCAHQRTRSH
jgi:hypothetical protein